jgi:ferritin-like metal-binding protein YciE
MGGPAAFGSSGPVRPRSPDHSDADNQTLDALPKMAEKSSGHELMEALEETRYQTAGALERASTI